MENKNTEKYRIFFRDLIVLARETMVAHKNNMEPKPHYFLTRLNNSKIWYQINYDVTLKKWLILKHDNKNEPVIFNPKVISGIQKFLEEFTLEDIQTAHTNLILENPKLNF
jgi:hypothetical protein